MTQRRLPAHSPSTNSRRAIASVPHLERAHQIVDLTNPLHVCQHVLDVSGDALTEDDFDLFAAFFSLPHDVDTFGMRLTLSDRNDLYAVFRNSRSHFEEAGATHRIRNCISATLKDDGRIIYSYLIRVMNGNYPLRDAIPCYGTLQAVDGFWLVTRSSYAVEETDRPYDRLLTRGGRPVLLPGERPGPA
jgi:hypothetical protein